jgi:DNA-binding transcriptional LysR family regulator
MVIRHAMARPLDTYLAGPLIRSGQLVQLLPNWQPPELTIWSVYLTRRRVPASLRAILDFLVGRCGQNPEWDSD